MRRLLPLTLVLALIVGFLWFLPEEDRPPTRLESMRAPLSALHAAPGDAALAEGRAWSLISERLGTKRLSRAEYQDAWASSDPVIQWAAWLAIEDFGTPDAGLEAALSNALDPDAPVSVRRVAAAAGHAFAAHLDPGMRPVLEQAVRDTEPRVRASALQTLAQMAPGDAKVWSLLTDALTDAQDGCREAAAAALAKIPFGDLAATRDLDPVVVPLRAALLDSREKVRMYATMAVGRIGPQAAEAVSDLIAILDGNSSALMQGHAATALGRIGEPALPQLGLAVRKVEVDRIPMVLWALRLVGAPAEETLRDVMKTHPNDAVRVVAALKLWELQRPVEPLLVTFDAALREGSTEARLQAARGLQRIGPAAKSLAQRVRDVRASLAPGADTETLRRALDAALESVTQ